MVSSQVLSSQACSEIHVSVYVQARDAGKGALSTTSAFRVVNEYEFFAPPMGSLVSRRLNLFFLFVMPPMHVNLGQSVK